MAAQAGAAPGIPLVIEENMTGASATADWTAVNGACLTAGDGTGPIKACVGLPYYSGSIQVGGTAGRLPDAVGHGALRLTNGDVERRVSSGGVSSGGTNTAFQNGAVVSNFTFPTNQGMKVTFTSMTYGGNGYLQHGADGMGFFLSDGSRPVDIGAPGGSLGYTCKNLLWAFDPVTKSFAAFPGNPADIPDNYEGVNGGYIGIGIDEFGNFSNSQDSTDTGLSGGYNPPEVPTVQNLHPERITLRGAGDTRWETLMAKYPMFYPTALDIPKRAEAVRNACRTGMVWDYRGTTTDANGKVVPTGVMTNTSLGYNYGYITSSGLPSGITLENQEGIPTPTRGAAMPVTYSLDISHDGILNFSYSYNGGAFQSVLTNQKITDSNGPLPASFRFGFTGSTGGGSNVHEITCFKAAQLDSASTSAATNLQPAARLKTMSQVYLAFNHPRNWWGQLTSQSLLEDPATDTVSINPVSNWDASCTLTGGACAATGSNVTAQAPGSRSMLSWNGSTGIPFEWASLTSAQQSQLTAGDPSASDARLQYLRGDRSGEVANGGGFRTRIGLLGDMQDSSPTWVGAPASPYDISWADALTPSASMPESGGQSYAAFRSTYSARQNLIYVGANDGWLHAFRAGASDVNGNFVTNDATPNDGREALAYMPAAVLASIHSSTGGLDFSNPLYSHNLYVDATPGTGDLYYGGAWHTWLVSGTGPARDANGPVSNSAVSVPGVVFALDITDPRRFSQANASSLVRGEWNSASMTCTNAAACGTHLGAVSGSPLIRRLHSGNWAALFGNGLNSAGGTAGLFIMMVDANSGAVSFRYLDTGAGPGADPTGSGSLNGIVNVTAADIDADHITDYVYAGDLFGNLWRFDLSSADPNQWSAAAAPMFRTTAGQPITSRVTVASVPAKGMGAKPRLIVSFGTGQQVPQSLFAAPKYASGTQALYGVWDWNMNAWNAKAGPGGKYEALGAPQTVGVSNLQAQAITATLAGDSVATGYRTVSRNPVCWAGSGDCAAGNNQFGWTLPLPDSKEQVIYNPSLIYGTFVVNTIVPAMSDALTCRQVSASGYTMAVDVGTGGASASSFFPDVATPLVAGIGLSATGSQSVVTTRKKAFIVQQTVAGQGVVTRINPPVSSGHRLNWIQLR